MQKKAIITTLSVMMATIIASVALVFAVGPLVSAARIDDGEPKIITISDWNDFEIDENGVCYGFSGSLLCDFLHFVEVGCGDLGPGDDSPEFDEMHIVIPEGVKSIAYQAFAPGGSGAYWNNWNITSFVIADSVESIGNSAFEYNDGLRGTVTIGAGVRSIGNRAFGYCYYLNSVIIPESVKTIGESAFEGCDRLKQVFVPSSVSEMGCGAFAHCNNTIVYCGAEWQPDEGWDWEWREYAHDESEYLDPGYPVYSRPQVIWDCELDATSGIVYQNHGKDATVVGYLGNDTAVVIPEFYDGVIVDWIGYGAFAGCSQLTSVTIPSSIAEIGSWAFAGCNMSIIIPDSVWRMGDAVFGAFYDYYTGYEYDFSGDVYCVAEEEPDSWNEDWDYQLNQRLVHYGYQSDVTVTFNSEGGSVVESQTFTANDMATEPADPTREGFDFEYWYVTDETEPFDFTQSITEDVTLHAKWQIKSYTVTFNTNEGTAVAEQTVEHGSLASNPTSSRTGYALDYWYITDEAVAFNFNTPITGNITLNAKWTPNKYNVFFETNGGTQIANQSVDYNTAATEPTDAPTKTGYTFKGWYANEGLTSTYDFTTPITNNTTIYAKWEINKYTVTFNACGGSEVAPEHVSHGDTLIAPTTTREGYTFKAWYVDAAYQHVYDFTTPVTGNTTLYAKWKINTYTVAFEANGGSEVDTQQINYSNTVTKPTTTRDGYNFKGWYTDAELNNEYDFATPVTSDLNLYAKWEAVPENDVNVAAIAAGATSATVGVGALSSVLAIVIRRRRKL